MATTAVIPTAIVLEDALAKAIEQISLLVLVVATPRQMLARPSRH